MNSRIFSTASRRLRLPSRSLALGAPTQRRLASSDRQPSNVSEFYKTFTRPVAKVLLIAVFTYQLAYWGWVKLEHDEIRAERQGEIAALERQVADLTRPLIPPLRTAGKEPTIEDYDRRISELDAEIREHRLKRQDRLDSEAVEAGRTGGEKKAAPWWKVW